MQSATRRRSITRNGVAAGSVWETRMKMDEVRGGIKVFDATGDGHDDEEGLSVYGKLRRNQSDGVGLVKRQRKNWKQPAPPRSPIGLRKARSTEIGCMRAAEEKGVLLISDESGIDEDKEVDDIEIEIEEQRGFDDKEIDLPAEKVKKVEQVKTIEEDHDMAVSIQPMAVSKKNFINVEDLKLSDPDPEPQLQGKEEEEILCDTVSMASNRMQHIVDLVMWRDVSKSSFAFGLGTFFFLSSSYAKDINISLISVISYMGLLYLALIFFLRSILRRGEQAEFTNDCLIGEEDAAWMLRRLLPYLNALLSKTGALFSGDPATTMKMAVILFLMARCGNFVTLWTLTKLVFYGIFTVPKLLSSYSVQLSRYSQFWLAQFRDGWHSCTHKKAVVFAIFILIWNLSSTIARIWAVFMLAVALKLYQQSMMMTLEMISEMTKKPEDQHQHRQQKWEGFTSRRSCVGRVVGEEKGKKMK